MLPNKPVIGCRLLLERAHEPGQGSPLLPGVISGKGRQLTATSQKHSQMEELSPFLKEDLGNTSQYPLHKYRKRYTDSLVIM